MGRSIGKKIECAPVSARRIGVRQNYWTVKESVRLMPAAPVADLFVIGLERTGIDDCSIV